MGSDEAFRLCQICAAGISGGILAMALYKALRSQPVLSKDRLAVFITGCDSGFGHSFALHAARSGYIVYAGCYGSFEGNFEGIDLLKNHSDLIVNKRLRILHLDVTNSVSIQNAKLAIEKDLKEESGHLLAVVNNAGFLIFAEAEWQNVEQVNKQYQVNTIGPWNISRQFIPLLISGNPPIRPRIVNILSYCTDCPFPCLSIYTSSKAALKTLSSGMRLEIAKYGVSVVNFNPGDSPSQTRMCCDQERHYAGMEPPNDPRRLEYFHRCQEKFGNLFPKQPIATLNDPHLYETFDAILGSPYPQNEYISSPLGTRIFFRILGFLPSGLADKIRISILQLPEY
uniref:Estradiol 17-beta-dehydrogenase 2 n=1 Tax=Caligus rogercresseyi TaxID=217165 RepID=C1BRP9_CALRO|nr:Estradiol 17-beta-dehydrogenase 2 [Caligus rogercresseyi]